MLQRGIYLVKLTHYNPSMMMSVFHILEPATFKDSLPFNSNKGPNRLAHCTSLVISYLSLFFVSQAHL